MIFQDNNKRDIIAIIPARGGSKGIPRKNIVSLCGKPLIAYSIEVALDSPIIDRVIVSTDDDEIASISSDMGAEIPFLRPPHLARDDSDLGAAINYTLDHLSEYGTAPELVVTLFPTHPFRNPRLVNSLVKKALEGYRMVKTVKRVSLGPSPLFARDDKGDLVPLKCTKNHVGIYQQDLFRTNGSVIVANYQEPLVHTFFLHVLDDPVTLIDIDTYDDLSAAEKIIRKGLFDFTLQ